MSFNKFQQAIMKQFALMQTHPLYRTTAEKDVLWDRYLSSFPESPRKSDVGLERMEYLLSWSFGGELPKRIGGTAKAPVWEVRKV